MKSNMEGETNATAAKGMTKATDLKEFLSKLATDSQKLGQFLHEPETAMSAANLSEPDKAALKSGASGMIAARLAGLPLDQAFGSIKTTWWAVQGCEAPAQALKEFLSELATDSQKLGQFLHEPEAIMSAAKLSEAEKAAVKSSVPTMVSARLAGVRLDPFS
jgi:chaperonin cofactor prefoldin